MIKKRVIIVASVLLIAAVALALLIFPFGASDRSAEIKVTRFIAKLNSTVLYQKDPPGGTGNPANLTTQLNLNDQISFELDWETISPATSVFQAGDTITIPIMTAPDIGFFPPASVPLTIDGTLVGTGNFSKVAKGTDQMLIFTIVFNAAAASKTVEGGFATGVCEIKGFSGSVTITWEDKVTTEYGPPPVQPVMGGMAFMKRRMQGTISTPGYKTFATLDAMIATNTNVLQSGFYFSIYTSQANAISDTNPISFVQTTSGYTTPRVYTHGAAGTQVTRMQIGGGYTYTHFLGLTVGQTYWIREMQAESPYILYSTPYSFTPAPVTSTPTWVALFNQYDTDVAAPGVPSGPVKPWTNPSIPTPYPSIPTPLKKGIFNLATTGSNPPVLGDAKHVYQALPDRNGEYFPSFQWGARFFGVQASFEANPERAKTGYVVFEDTITSNLEFSNFAETGTKNMDLSYSPFYGSSGYNGSSANHTYGRGTTNTSKNDFFALQLVRKVFDFDVYIPELSNNNYGYLHITQYEFTYIVKDADFAAENNKYSSPTKKLSDVPGGYANVRDAVYATPKTYCLIKNTNGTSTLIINAGKFGKGMTAAEGFGGSEVYNVQSSLGSTARNTLPDMAGAYLRQALLMMESITQAYSHTVSPYRSIVDSLPAFDSLLAEFAPSYNSGANMNLFVGTVNPQNKYATAAEYTAAYNAATAAWAAYKTAVTAYLQGGQYDTAYAAWPQANSIYRYDAGNTGTYSGLYKFLNKITAGRSPVTQRTREEGDPNRNARYILAQRVHQAMNGGNSTSALDVQIYNYASDMNALRTTTYDKAVTARNACIKSMLFYYPDMRTEMARQLNLPVYASVVGSSPTPNDILTKKITSAQLSDAALIEAAFQDGIYGRGGSYSGADKYQKWYARWEKLGRYGGNPASTVDAAQMGWLYFWTRSNLQPFMTATKISGTSITANQYFSDLGISAVQLKYRAIMTDTSKPTIGNTLKVSITDQLFEDEINYKYRYSAGIYGNTRGGAAFVKADAAVNGKTPGWYTMASLDSIGDVSLKLTGAGFSIYATQAEAAAGTNPIKFKADAVANTYQYDPAGTITVITTTSTGAFQIIGLSGTKFWIKEVNHPPGYEAFAAPYEFSVSASGSEPKCYALYDKEIENEPINVEIKGRKETIGTVPAGEKFTFVLTQVADASGAPYTATTPPKITASKQLTSAGPFSFLLAGLTAGEYYFTLKETPGTAPNGSYDETVYLVKVIVSGSPLQATVVATVLA